MTDLEERILAYLKEHPNASDTLEGIVVWWIPRMPLAGDMENVRRALEHMVAMGLISARLDSAGRARYWLNKEE